MGVLFSMIREARYTMPPSVPKLAQDLIRRMLRVNPIERITIPEIKHHEWYQEALPFYISIMDNTKASCMRTIDEPSFAELAGVSETARSSMQRMV